MTSYNSYGVTRFDRKQAGYGSIADVLGDIELMNVDTGEIVDVYGGFFVSYSSIIFFYERDFNSNTVHIYRCERWGYSRTTSKQTTQFLQRFYHNNWHVEFESGTYEYRIKGRNYWNAY